MTQNKQLNRAEVGYNGFYLERSGEHAATLVETLLSPPELPLTEDEKEEVYGFERELSQQIVSGDETLEAIIKGNFGEDIVAPMYFAQPFLEGKVQLEGITLPEFTNEADVYRTIAVAVRDKTLSPVQLRTLSKQSTAHYSASVEQALLAGEPIDEKDVRAHSIVVEPEAFLEYANNVTNARTLLHDYRKVYKEGDARLDGARRAVADVYLGRINEIIAQTIPRADYLIAQAILIGDRETISHAMDVVPKNLRDKLFHFRTHADLMKRLDYLRNGVAFDDSGASTAINEETLGEPIDPEAAVSSKAERHFSDEQKEILRNTMVQPEVMQKVMTAVIERAGLLSSEDSGTWSPDRKRRAEDELFQVVLNPGQRTFAVDGVSGAYKVASTERSLYDLMTVGGFHELSHINQAQADRELGKQLKIAELKGKRVAMIREAGANMEQRRAEKRYFGSDKPFASTYAHALESLEDGRGMADAIQEFYKEKRRISPDISPEKAAEEAADRVVRLVRQGGFSSQPMVYAEEAILEKELRSLSPSSRARATAITGLDLVDQARLHKYGLIPEINNNYIDWAEYILEELQPYIEDALQVSPENV